MSWERRTGDPGARRVPLAALAIGLPFAVVMWTYWCLGPRMAAPQGFMATPPAKLFPGAIGIGILILLLMAAWFTYMCYGLVTGRGIIGWLNAVQAASDGKFSTKLSLIVAFVYLLCAMGVIGLAGGLAGGAAATGRRRR